MKYKLWKILPISNKMQQKIYADKRMEEQIVDQYLCGDTASRVFATLEYFTYRSINKQVPGIFAKYNGKNNSGMTKTLEQLKRQLKTHVLSFLASHQDMINNYGSYPYPNNFKEKDARNFILTCEKLVKDPDVKIHCKNLISIINQDYQTVLNYYMNTQKIKKAEMDPNEQIKKFMPAVGMSYELEQKAASLAQKGRFEHKIEINELAKKKLDVQASFLNVMESLRHYAASYLSKEEIQKNIEDFYNDFIQNYDYFEYPDGYDQMTTKAILYRLSTKNKNLQFYCLIVNYIILKKFTEAYNMINIL